MESPLNTAGCDVKSYQWKKIGFITGDDGKQPETKNTSFNLDLDSSQNYEVEVWAMPSGEKKKITIDTSTVPGKVDSFSSKITDPNKIKLSWSFTSSNDGVSDILGYKIKASNGQSWEAQSLESSKEITLSSGSYSFSITLLMQRVMVRHLVKHF